MPPAQLADRFLEVCRDPPGVLTDLLTAVLQPGDLLLL
jgi:hypothetical protein